MIIADTGFWVALANRNDTHHERAQECLNTLPAPLVLTWPVMTETCHILLKRAGGEAQLAFIEGFVKEAFTVFSLKHEHAEKIFRLLKKYSDLPMDLADASLVILAEHLGHGRILSTDKREFRTYRWKNREPFQNLLLPDYP